MGILKSSFRKWERLSKFRLRVSCIYEGPQISKLRDWCSHSGSRLHDSLQVAKNNNVEIQCGRVLLLIWKMTLLDFLDQNSARKCEYSLACFQFGQLSKMDTSGIRKKSLS